MLPLFAHKLPALSFIEIHGSMCCFGLYFRISCWNISVLEGGDSTSLYRVILSTVDSLQTLQPAATGTDHIATRKPYQYASGVLVKNNMPATIAGTVLITNSYKEQLLVDYTKARRQQIAAVLRTGIEDYTYPIASLGQNVIEAYQ